MIRTKNNLSILLLSQIFLLLTSHCYSHEQVRVKSRQSFDAVNVPLLGSFTDFYFYYTSIKVGTPAIPFTVIVDTGSSDLLIPNWGCDSCAGDPSTFYSSSNSSSSTIIKCTDTIINNNNKNNNNGNNYTCNSCSESNNQCTYQVPLTGITEIALLTNDITTVGPLSVNTNFGAITNITMSGYLQRRKSKFPMIKIGDDYPEGLVGMAYQKLSGSGSPTFFDSLVSGAKLPNIFSLCFNSNGVGGILTLGGIPALSSPISYTPLVSEDFYSVYMNDMTVGGKSLGLPPSVYNTEHCITDSGTPYPTVPKVVFQSLTKYFNSLCSSKSLHGVCDAPAGQTLFDGQCFEYTPSQIAAFPAITFVLNSGVVLNYTSDQYLSPTFFCNNSNTKFNLNSNNNNNDNKNKDNLQLGLGIIEDDSNFGLVIGLSVLRSVITVHDRINDRIGFAARNRDKC